MKLRWIDPLYPLRKLALLWFDSPAIPMPISWAPWVLGFGLNSWPKQVKK